MAHEVGKFVERGWGISVSAVNRSPQVTAEVYAHLLSDTQLDDAMGAFE